MKKTFKNIRTLAALLMAGAAFAACSSDDSIVENQQPANPGEQVYTLTIKASNGDATTRALDLDGTGKLTASWANGDVLTVYNVTQDVALSGSLTASNASGSTADFTGTLSGPINEDDVLTLTYHPIISVQAFQSQDGTLKGTKGAEKYDMATATVTVNTIPVLGEITIKETEASFTTKVAMIKLTLTDGTNAINATSLNVKATFTISTYPAKTDDVLTFTIPTSTYTDTYGGDGILYFALPSAATVAAQLYSKYTNDPYNLPITSEQALAAITGATITFTATVGGTTYTTTKPGYKFAAGKYYKATLTMTKAAAEATAEDKGKLIGTDGNIYADVAAATAAGTTAVAKIIYLGTTGHATYNHGLALALTDEGQMVWQDAINACSAKNTSTRVTDATWLLASKEQWEYMMGANGAGSYDALRDGFGGITGADNLQSGHYWSSTAPNDEEACNYDFDNGYWFDDYKEGYDYLVRACLAF